MIWAMPLAPAVESGERQTCLLFPDLPPPSALLKPGYWGPVGAAFRPVTHPGSAVSKAWTRAGCS